MSKNNSLIDIITASIKKVLDNKTIIPKVQNSKILNLARNQ